VAKKQSLIQDLVDLVKGLFMNDEKPDQRERRQEAEERFPEGGNSYGPPSGNPSSGVPLHQAYAPINPAPTCGWKAENLGVLDELSQESKQSLAVLAAMQPVLATMQPVLATMNPALTSLKTAQDQTSQFNAEILAVCRETLAKVNDKPSAGKDPSDMLLRDLLQILDQVTTVFLSTKDENLGEVRKSLQTLVSRYGILENSPLAGTNFDPNEAEGIAIKKTDDAAMDGKIAEVKQAGYFASGRRLRFAKVSVYQFQS
jgi:molecular chaperone GrpE (heat shock protein)